jgi:hypothetical protein
MKTMTRTQVGHKKFPSICHTMSWKSVLKYAPGNSKQNVRRKYMTLIREAHPLM